MLISDPVEGLYLPFAHGWNSPPRTRHYSDAYGRHEQQGPVAATQSKKPRTRLVSNRERTLHQGGGLSNHSKKAFGLADGVSRM